MHGQTYKLSKSSVTQENLLKFVSINDDMLAK
ncbi:MAG: hypothetical protein K0S74_922 [Chlamydiales bacterium]|jgi:hypothetical protein|nr:hypothetical protein [Chlamydiales bacterium]